MQSFDLKIQSSRASSAIEKIPGGLLYGPLWEEEEIS